MPQRQTTHVTSHVPVGQPLYIFDVGTHKFDGTLYQSRAHTHTHIIPLIDSMDTSTRWYLHSLLVDRPLYIYDISRTLFHTRCICYIFWLKYHPHILLVYFSPPPKKTLTNPHTISLYVCISLTQPHVGGVRIQEENRCTVHVLTLHAQPHPRGYAVELISLRSGSPRANLNACSGCYLGRSCTTRAWNKVRLDALPLIFK